MAVRITKNSKVAALVVAIAASGVALAPAASAAARGEEVTTVESSSDRQPGRDTAFVPGGAVRPTSTPLAAARGTGKVAALTFDVIGQNITAPGGAEILRRIVTEGHTLCNHSTSYADMGSWSPTQVDQDLRANLATIREVLGDPAQKVPYFRAPNGSWGKTGEVAASLGMQPLGLGNVIFDWDGNDLSEETLASNLRAAIQPGAVALAHDGGGDRENTVDAVATVLPEKLAEGFTFSLPQGGVPDEDWSPRP
jgi:endo-1,4-beta-xylanase